MGTEGQGSREKRGSRGRAAGLLGRRLLPREEPRPGQGPAGGGAGAGLHPAPPLPAEMLANQSAVCLGDGQEPVEGGPVCGAAGNCPGAESAQTPPSARGRPAPPQAECPDVSGPGAGWGAGRIPLDAALQNSRLYKQPPAPAQRQGELGGPEPTKAPHPLGLQGTGSVRGAESSASAGPFLISTSQNMEGPSSIPCFPASKATHSVVKLY